MKETRQRFLFFTAGDFKGVQRDLNEQAAEGWELVSTEHFLTGTFARTARRELSYHVTPIPPWEREAERRERLRECEDAGWELVGTVNRLRIFKSMPCRHPAETADGAREARELRRYAVRRVVGNALYLLLIFGLSVLPALVSRGSGSVWEALRSWAVHSWYESCFAGVVLIVLPLLLLQLLLEAADGAADALRAWRWMKKRGVLPVPSRWRMYFHSAGELLSLAEMVCLLAATALDGLADGTLFVTYLWLGLWIACLLLEIFVEASGRTYTRGQKKRLARLAAGLLACAAAVALLDWTGPLQHEETAARSGSTDVTHAGWRTEIGDRPVVRQEDLGLIRTLFSAEYSHGISLAASWWRYEEDSLASGEVESRCYRFWSETAAQWAAEDLAAQAAEGSELDALLGRGGYSLSPLELDGFDACWYGVRTAADGTESSALVLRRGRTAALVIAPADLLEAGTLDAVRQELGL